MPTPRPIHLLRWFAGLSALVIAALSVANAALMSGFLNEQLFQREASVSRDFVQNILVSDGSLEYLQNPSDPALQALFKGTIVHLGNLRDVVRANVYSRDRRLLWSTSPNLAGSLFQDNEELEEALRGELVTHSGRIDSSELNKREHEGLAPQARFFVETYIPVRAPDGQVIGVVELYKAPVALTEAIHAARWRMGLAALVGGALLFGSLFSLVRRADRQLRSQQAQLLEAETLAATGQLAAAVAHNIRNPLASIRSSAELLLDAPPDQVPDGANDILRDADRISERITELLRLAAPVVAESQLIDLRALLAEFGEQQTALFKRHQQSLQLTLPDQAAWSRGDAQLLRHALQSLLANASEAMGPGGQCEIRLLPRDKWWVIAIQDNGCGIAPDALSTVQQAFVTTKPQGLGLGLLLARRIIERLGGHFDMTSVLGTGTTVRLDLPKARKES